MRHGIAAGLVLALSGVIAGSQVGCGGGGSRAETPSPAPTDQSADDMALASDTSGSAAEAEPAPPPPPPPMVVAGEHTPLEGAAPTLRITSPRANQTIRTGNVTVRLQLRNWPLEAPQGPHVHMILDNEPYIAIRDVAAPIDVNAQVQQHLGHELTEGTHVLRFFPSRGHHESVKDGRAFASVVFHYRSATEGFTFDATGPLLTYSRPKGCNPVGERVLLDFFVTNVELAAEGPRVRWTLDGQTGEITSWVPHFIENLEEGEHSLQLTLLGADGTPTAGPFNDTTRTFTIASACPE
jgi:hypothetical protein